MNIINKISERILGIAKSRAFYWFIIGFFVLESAFIALSALYPQAFDEQFHFGLIKLYSHHLSPFLAKQPAGGNPYGAVARDPSYLFHYLMSFPYRLIALITKQQSYQIIALRFIDIAMFAYGLTLFRKILLKIKLSKGLANVSLFIFTLIPIVPQLAGQINYDDMCFPLVAAVCLLTFRLIDQIKNKELRFSTLSWLIIIATLTSLVKYAFLPIYLAVVCFLIFYLIYQQKKNLKKIWLSLVLDFQRMTIWAKLGLIALLIISIGMFAQRDLVNVIDYHSVAPNCASVISSKDCRAYYVWSSDNARHQAVLSKKTAVSKDFLTYPLQWIYWMWYRLFFAVNGVSSGYKSYPPLPLPSAAAILLAVASLVALIRYYKQIFKANAYTLLLLAVCLVYVIALIVQGYSTYRFTAVLENMNGRYLLPILLLAAGLAAKALSLAFRKHRNLRLFMAALVVLLFLEGGGVLTYITRSNSSWYWDNSSALKVNNAAKKVTNKVLLKGPTTYDTRVWFFN